MTTSASLVQITLATDKLLMAIWQFGNLAIGNWAIWQLAIYLSDSDHLATDKPLTAIAKQILTVATDKLLMALAKQN